jgi:hypothetical protein
MLSQSRGLRFALVLLMSLGYVAWDGHRQVAYAEDDEEDGGDDGGDGGDEPEEPEEPEEDEDQPPVTAGGLFTMKTYPVRELDRPLTITQGIAQARLGVGVDVSAKGAFESFGVSLEGRYGFRDNVMGIGGFTSAYNFKQFGVYAGFEAALSYDLIDFRSAIRLSRAATPKTEDMMGVPVVVPGEYQAGKISGGIDIGFPFRYVAKPEIAIVALDTLMSIDFDSKPDLKPSLGISTNPIPALSVVIFATVQIIDFDTDVGFTVPATARVQFSPSRKMDLGAEFTFLNVKPPEGVKFYDNRFLTLYVQGRFGK